MASEPASQPASAPASAPGGHRKLSLALVVVGTVLAVAAIFSIWANRQALNTDNWVRTSDRILANKEVETRLSAYMADQIFANVDVKAEPKRPCPRSWRRWPVRPPLGSISWRRKSPNGCWPTRTSSRSGPTPTAPPTKPC